MIHALHTLAVLVPLSLGAGEGDSAEWLELDREIASLTSAPSAKDGGVRAKLDIITSIQHSEDPFYQPTPGDDLAGVQLRRARATFLGDFDNGSHGTGSYRVAFETSSGAARLTDAFITWEGPVATRFTTGRFKNPFLWTARSSGFLEHFHDLTITGGANNDRQLGAIIEGNVGDFDWLFCLQNGVDGVVDETKTIGRVQWNIVGANAFGKHHGAWGYGSETQISVAASSTDDGGISDGSLTAAEFGMVADGLSFRADMIAYDDNYDDALSDPDLAMDLDDVLDTPKAGTEPATVTLGYLFTGNEWEVLARWEEFDDSFDTNRSSLGIVWYGNTGPTGRWSLIYQEMASNDSAGEGSRLELSFSLASS